MRLNDERAIYGLADDGDRPDPATARNAAEFVALLGALVDESGLSLSEIEELAKSKGYVLPEQIVATMLDHDALPPEELVVALVRSIGINDREVKYWVEVLWRLESRTAYDPAQADQPRERQAPRDIEQIYGTKDEPGSPAPFAAPAAFEAAQPASGIDPYLEPAAMGPLPYRIPAPNEVVQVPEVDEAYEDPAFYEDGDDPDADEHYEHPVAVEAHEAEPHPGEAPYAADAGYEQAEYDEPHVEAQPVSPAHAVQQRGGRHSWTGRHHRDDHEDEYEAGYEDGYQDDGVGVLDQAPPVHPYDTHDPRDSYDTRDTWVVRPVPPRIRRLATRSISRVNRKSRWPLPVAVGLSIVLAGSIVAWMVIGGSGQVPASVAGGPPGSTQNKTGSGSTATGGGASPATTDGGVPTGGPGVVPGTDTNPAPDPNNPNIPGNPNPQPTTQGPQPTTTEPRTYNTQLSGSGSTSCIPDGGQWRVRITVNVTVTDPPQGLTPQGQGGVAGSMQGFSLSSSDGTHYSGSTSVLVGPTGSPNVGTVQWVVTISVPGGRTARDESFEGYSCV